LPCQLKGQIVLYHRKPLWGIQFTLKFILVA
jgi:hypothetical protein